MRFRDALDTEPEYPHLMNDPDMELMKRALDLARRGAGLVSPNPMVGAVVIKDGRIVGEGFHRYDLVKHAEVNALEMAGTDARGAIIYCSLEPCCHHGRTTPCTDAIIEAGISKAIIAAIDPNPRVNGRGLELLRRAGIEVDIGLCARESRHLNEIYIKFVTTGRPFLHAVFVSDTAEWNPSDDFIRNASHYDTIVLSDSLRLNELIIDGLISRQRHRPLRLITTSDKSSVPESIYRPESENVILLTLNPNLDSIIEQLARSDETSALILQGEKFIGDWFETERFDKITAVLSPEDDSYAGFAQIDNEDESVTGSSNIIEAILYPHGTEQSEQD